MLKLKCRLKTVSLNPELVPLSLIISEGNKTLILPSPLNVTCPNFAQGFRLSVHELDQLHPSVSACRIALLLSYHFSDQQHSFPGGGELFAGENREQDGLARPARVRILDVPHCWKIHFPSNPRRAKTTWSSAKQATIKRKKTKKRESGGAIWAQRWKRKHWQRGNELQKGATSAWCRCEMWSTTQVTGKIRLLLFSTHFSWDKKKYIPKK